MVWRVIDAEDEVWHVQVAAERRPDARTWQLSLSFRCQQEGGEARTFWTAYPLESGSKTLLLRLADRIRNDELRQVLQRHNT